MANPEITTGVSWAVVSNTNPTALDSSYPLYFGWINSTNGRVHYLLDNTPDNADWSIMPTQTLPAAFTPTIRGSGTPGAGTYTTQIGRFFRIGPMVQIHINLVWTAHTGTGDMQIGALPLQPNTVITQIGIPELQSIILPVGALGTYAKSRSDLRLDIVASIAGAVQLPVALSASGTLQLSMSYYL